MSDPKRIDTEMARALLPRRDAGAHKWGVGGVFFLAGAPQYLGAVAMSARSAGRSGAGIVTLAVPRQMMSTIQTVMPEATFSPLADTDSVSGARRAIESMRDRAERSKAYVMGPGLGDDESVSHLLAAIFRTNQSSSGGSSPTLGFAVRNSDPAESKPLAAELPSLPDHPMVLDADGLNWLSSQDDWPALLTDRSMVLTPHPGEAGRLLDQPVGDVIKDPVATAISLAKRAGQTVVFKYEYTIVTDGSEVRMADEAPVSLATAGTGDVLSGSIGAFLAQGLSPVDAASLAVYLGSRAATRLEARFGTLGVVASDLPDAIGEQIAELERKDGGGND